MKNTARSGAALEPVPGQTLVGSATPAERIRDYSRLSRTEEGLILKLADDGLNQPQIAQRLGCSQPTVSRVLSEFSDTRQLAKRRLNARADKLTQRLINKAGPAEILEVLDRLEVAPKRQTENGKAGVTVVIGVQDSAVQVQIGGESASLEPVLSRHNPSLSTQVLDAQVLSSDHAS